MSVQEQELKRLLSLYRKGHISEEVLLEQMAEVGNDASISGDASVPAPNGVDTAAAQTREQLAAAARAELVAALDSSRAAEASGACTLEAWAKLTPDKALEGGLRTAAAREATHALLLEQRIVELGAQPTKEIPEWLARFNAALLEPEASDLDRLSAIVAQFPDLQQAEAQLDAMAAAAVDDDLTRELLLTIRDDELATLRWMHSAFQRVKNAS